MSGEELKSIGRAVWVKRCVKALEASLGGTGSQAGCLALGTSGGLGTSKSSRTARLPGRPRFAILRLAHFARFFPLGGEGRQRHGREASVTCSLFP
jgi:hypothetical protein